MGKEKDKYALELASPLNKLVARVGADGNPAIVMPQQVAFPVKTVWRVPIPLIKRLFGRTQVFRVITQVVVYPRNGSNQPDVDRALICMTLRRSKKWLGLKGAMKDDWDEVWDSLEIMQKVNGSTVEIRGSRDKPPYES